jgi:hypothetical protein
MKKSKSTKKNVFKLIYPDGTETITNYDPTKKDKLRYIKYYENGVKKGIEITLKSFHDIIRIMLKEKKIPYGKE